LKIVGEMTIILEKSNQVDFHTNLYQIIEPFKEEFPKLAKLAILDLFTPIAYQILLKMLIYLFNIKHK